mmetsp:Transcript_13947/g.16829  ORF Transcript_13947/g.16829 Transcript_13947/m.16829 type:complete len:198 (-) Transcript_13947:619-1212(-)
MTGMCAIRSCTARATKVGALRSRMQIAAAPMMQTSMAQRYPKRAPHNLSLAVTSTTGSSAKIPLALSAPARSLSNSRMVRALSTSGSAGDGPSLEQLIVEKNEQNPIMIYSKSYCPFCTQVKSLFSEMEVDYTAVELDNIVEADAIQDTLLQMTGQRTVPNVFIGGNHIGGCDDTFALLRSGDLEKIVKEANAAKSN